MSKNILLQTDSYKVSHWLQFPQDSKRSFYYIESRGGADEVLFYGLQMVIKKLLNRLPTVEEVYQANDFWKAHGLDCFNTNGWLKLIELGYYPLQIKAVTEGRSYQTKTPLVTVESTVDGFEWLPGWLETRLLQVWYPITVATKINECKKVIFKNLVETGTPEAVNFKLHSFGYRGVSSEESAGIGASAELVSFMGTDTVAGILCAQDYYNSTGMLGFSIPAAEHSTVTSWGKEGEFLAYKNMLTQFAKPGALVAVVSDSYNLTNAVENGWCGELKQQVIDSGATLIVRPDSGNPTDVVLRTLNQLADGFGVTVNEKGYKVLNGVRIIQGDSIDGPRSITDVLNPMKAAGWSGDNVAFGMGGGSLQQVNRDTYKFAMKCSAILVGDTWRDVYKEPFDAPWKASKKGRLETPDLDLVWKDGRFIKEYTFEQVRENAASQYKV